MDKITEWGQVRLVCPCGGISGVNISFSLKKKGGLIYFQCINPDCVNSFPADIQVKVMQLLNKYYEKHKTFEGFSNYFRIKDDSMRLRYIGIKNITSDYQTVVIEVANLTKQPQFKDANQGRRF